MVRIHLPPAENQQTLGSARGTSAGGTHMQLAREADIVDEGPLPGQQRWVLQPSHREDSLLSERQGTPAS